MLQDISFLRLRVFCEVVESQGFRAASERLNMSQPAISAHINALEKQLQTVLLERGRFTKVTEAGAIFYDFAKEILNKAEQISREINDLRNANVGSIAVAAGVTIGRYILPYVFSEFKRKNPNVEMTLRIGNQKKICEMILNREVDIGFTVGNSPLNGVISTTLTKIEQVFVVGPGHPLAKRETVYPEDLSDYPFILPAKNVEALDVQRLLEQQKIDVKDVLMTSEDPETNKKFVKDNLGISVMLITSVFDDILNQRLVKLNLSFQPHYVKLRLITHPDKHFSPMQLKFINFCKNTIPHMNCHQSP